MRIRSLRRVLSVAAVGAAIVYAGLPANANGFSISEQGTKAMGMAIAFTAQADDPSAIFYNVGGMAFQDEQAFMAGVTLVSLGASDFRGAAPFPGSGDTADQKSQIVTPPHAYWVRPINDRVVFGLGLESPFGLVTEWDNPDTFSGRFISERAELQVVDINPSIAFKATDTLGIGIGLIGRATSIELDSRVAQINPFTLTAVEVAAVNLKSDLDTGFGFNVGLLHRPNDFFSWGFSYRSAIEVDYGGDGRFTQTLTGNAQFDGAVAGQIPFGQDLPIETSLEFPTTASVGVAFKSTEHLTFETDFNWTGWSSFDTIDIAFLQNPTFDTSIDSNWENAYNVRVGFSLDREKGHVWRWGAYFDETPQPDAGVGPLLPDADRFGLTLGYGHEGEKRTFDLALMYIQFEDRTTLTNGDGFNGTYETSTLLLGGSIGW